MEMNSEQLKKLVKVANIWEVDLKDDLKDVKVVETHEEPISFFPKKGYMIVILSDGSAHS